MDYGLSTHQPVLLQELIDALEIAPEDIVVDGTLGGAGHAAAIVERLSEVGCYIGIDQDATSIRRAKERLANAKPQVHLVEGNFRNLDTILAELGISAIDALVLDLGLSSDQLEPKGGEKGRGFSFRREEQLLMTFRFEPAEGDTTAYDIVNNWSEEHIADVLRGFSEERFSGRIAREIVQAREEQPIATTTELVSIIERAMPHWYRRRKIHPATRTFQALRMAVNDELGALRDGLEKGFQLLGTDGRLAVISFHSVEDRVVKTYFSERVRAGEGTLTSKKPISPSEEEVRRNPRARSAKLRTLTKT